MPNWKVGSETKGQLQLIFVSKDDIINFVNTVVKPNAEALGLEIVIVDKGSKDRKGFEVVRI